MDGSISTICFPSLFQPPAFDLTISEIIPATPAIEEPSPLF